MTKRWYRWTGSWLTAQILIAKTINEATTSGLLLGDDFQQLCLSLCSMAALTSTSSADTERNVFPKVFRRDV